jgi:hypothetical protein
MTRSRHPTQAARARTKHRAGAGAVSAPVSMKFRSFGESGGAVNWAIVAASRDRLAHSASVASCEEATRAAGIVRCGAGSVPFEDRAQDIPRSSSPPAARRRRCETIWM